MSENRFYGKTIFSIALMMAFVFLGMGLGLCATAPTSTNHENSPVLAVSLVSQIPDPAMAGDTVDLRFGVENDGGVTAENVALEIAGQYPFTLVSGSGSIVSVGTISPYQADSDMRVAKATLKVDSGASAGIYQLKVWVYQAGRKDEFYSEKIFSISVGSQANAQVISIDKTEIVPGRETPLSFVVKNVGKSPLKDMTFSWSSEDNVILPVGSDNTRHIDSLGIGQETTLVYNVSANADATAGLYKLTLNMAYKDSATGTQSTSSTVAGMYVGGGTDFDVAYSESSGSEVSFSVANIGNNPAYSVSVKVPDQQGWILTGSNSVIIGNLNKGDYTVASFTLTQTGSNMASMNRTRDSSGNRTGTAIPSSNSGPLKINVEYTDTRGERKVYAANVSMASSSANSSAFGAFSQNGSSARFSNNRGAMGGMGGLSNGMSGIVTICLWAVGGVIVLGAAYYLYRRRKAKKANEAKRLAFDKTLEKTAAAKARK